MIIQPLQVSISANTNGPHDAALCKIDDIALHAKCNSQAMSDMCTVKLKLHLVDLLSTYYMNKFCQKIHNKLASCACKNGS